MSDESFCERWFRRACSIASVFGLCLALTLCLPLLLPVAILVSFFRDDMRAAARALLLIEFILLCETAGIIGSFWLWARHRLRRGCDQEQYEHDNFALQCWWASTLARFGMKLFDVKIHVEEPFKPGKRPIFLFVRHVSFVDTLIPSLLIASSHGLKMRYILKRELLWDPCLDIVGNRLPNYFVRRGSERSSEEVQRIASLAENLDHEEGVVIFPEGTRFSRTRRAQILEKFATEEPGNPRYQQALELKHVLPPRHGGVLTLLEINPGADVVFCAHTGLEDALTVRDLVNGAMVGRVIHVAFWRVQSNKLPRDRDGRIAWLEREWKKMDAFVENHRKPSEARGALISASS